MHRIASRLIRSRHVLRRKTSIVRRKESPTSGPAKSPARNVPVPGVESQETRGLLAAAINSLSEREKIVVTLYYFEGLTLAEIGEILGVTESRVCQIHTKAVGGLRGQLSEVD